MRNLSPFLLPQVHKARQRRKYSLVGQRATKIIINAHNKLLVSKPSSYSSSSSQGKYPLLLLLLLLPNFRQIDSLSPFSEFWQSRAQSISVSILTKDTERDLFLVIEFCSGSCEWVSECVCVITSAKSALRTDCRKLCGDGTKHTHTQMEWAPEQSREHRALLPVLRFNIQITRHCVELRKIKAAK